MLQLFVEFILVVCTIIEAVLNEGLILRIGRNSLERHVIESDQVVELNKLLQCVVILGRILLLEVLIPQNDGRLHFIRNVVKARAIRSESNKYLHAVLDLSRRSERIDDEGLAPSRG